jgi:hypothetical protein
MDFDTQTAPTCACANIRASVRASRLPPALFSCLLQRLWRRNIWRLYSFAISASFAFCSSDLSYCAHQRHHACA